MTTLQDPQYLQPGSHTAQGDRLVLESLVAVEGVGGADDLQVVEKGTPDMSVNVGSGTAFVAGTEQTFQGLYHVANDLFVNRAVAAADATNPRIDLVVARVKDSFYSGADDEWDIEVITGTAEASPSEPAVPDNSLVLARIDVAASASSITNADITDRRHQASVPYGLRQIVVFSADGTFSKGDYPWLRGVRARVNGAGGGSGGTASTAAGENAASGGGGGGGYAEKWIDAADLSANETVTVGVGGSAAPSGNNPGGTGETSSFGAHCSATGGGGGGGSAATSSNIRNSGGNRGSGSGGDINLDGDDGGWGIVLAGSYAMSAVGGGSPLGGGQASPGNNSGGVQGHAFGAGASGTTSAASQSSRGGLAGRRGQVIVELYA